jgi:hypothetical protein
MTEVRDPTDERLASILRGAAFAVLGVILIGVGLPWPIAVGVASLTGLVTGTARVIVSKRIESRRKQATWERLDGRKDDTETRI